MKNHLCARNHSKIFLPHVLMNFRGYVIYSSMLQIRDKINIVGHRSGLESGSSERAILSSKANTKVIYNYQLLYKQIHTQTFGFKQAGIIHPYISAPG